MRVHSAQQHRRVELLGQLDRRASTKSLHSCESARLEHGQLGGDGVVAGILLILGRMHARVIRHGYDQSAVHARVGRR